MTSCLITTEHPFWTMQIEGYYDHSMADESKVRVDMPW
jgi:hypothetical protein